MPGMEAARREPRPLWQTWLRLIAMSFVAALAALPCLMMASTGISGMQVLRGAVWSCVAVGWALLSCRLWRDGLLVRRMETRVITSKSGRHAELLSPPTVRSLDASVDQPPGSTRRQSAAVRWVVFLFVVASVAQAVSRAPLTDAILETDSVANSVTGVCWLAVLYIGGPAVLYRAFTPSFRAVAAREAQSGDKGPAAAASATSRTSRGHIHVVVPPTLLLMLALGTCSVTVEMPTWSVLVGVLLLASPMLAAVVEDWVRTKGHIPAGQVWYIILSGVLVYGVSLGVVLFTQSWLTDMQDDDGKISAVGYVLLMFGLLFVSLVLKLLGIATLGHALATRHVFIAQLYEDLLFAVVFASVSIDKTFILTLAARLLRGIALDGGLVGDAVGFVRRCAVSKLRPPDFSPFKVAQDLEDDIKSAYFNTDLAE